MREKTLNFLGLMRRANAVEIGETGTGEAVKNGKAKLVLIASDISDNSRKRAETFVYGRRAVLVKLPFTKEEITKHLGVGCSMLAVTDIGFADAMMKKLCELDGEAYAEAAATLAARHEKAERRKAEKHGTDRNKNIGKRRTNK